MYQGRWEEVGGVGRRAEGRWTVVTRRDDNEDEDGGETVVVVLLLLLLLAVVVVAAVVAVLTTQPFANSEDLCIAGGENMSLSRLPGVVVCCLRGVIGSSSSSSWGRLWEGGCRVLPRARLGLRGLWERDWRGRKERGRRGSPSEQ